jgi:hypothetical protein
MAFLDTLKRLATPFGGVKPMPGSTPMTVGGQTTPSMTMPSLASSATALTPGQFGAPVIPQVKAPQASATGPAVAKPAVPAVSVANTFTTPSGAVVDASGAMVTPPPTSGGGSSTQTTPETPAVPAAPSAAQTAFNSAEKAYQESLKISPDELSTQEDIDKLIESTKTAFRNTSGQAIPMEFITGQLKSIEDRATGLAEPLERKLARLQAARQSSVESSKFALERSEKKLADEKALGAPQSVAQGTAIVKYNPTTGKYENVFTNPKDEAKPASVQEYEYAVKNGYTGSYQQYQNDDANRKRAVTNVYGGTGSSPEVDSWVKLINTGQAKITSVPASLKNAVAQALGEAPASGRNLVQDAVDAISTLRSTSGKSAAIGTNITFGFGKNLPGRSSAGYLAQLDKVKSLLTLPNLQYMKGLGAMSDREFNTISSSVAALNPNMTEAQFDAELDRIDTIMQAAALKLQGGGSDQPAQMQLPNGTVVTRQADGTYK